MKGQEDGVLGWLLHVLVGIVCSDDRGMFGFGGDVRGIRVFLDVWMV